MYSTTSDITAPELSDREFSLFRELISSKTGISLRDTKCPMLSSRLQRRLRYLNLTSFAAYYEFLLNQDQTGGERRELINCITTNKTSFFREPHHFNSLAELFQLSIDSSPQPRPFSIWSAACSSGEEPYSMAMTLSEVLHKSRSNRTFSILATDIDTQVLEFGRAAIYTEPDIEPVPTPFRQRFFLRGSGSQLGRYRVKPTIRELIDFRQLNLIDPVWDVNARFDAIFCRNALIYFERQTQDQILRRLISYLKPRGYLMVGHSEQLHWLTDVLELVGTTTYRVKDGI